jgi:hypothetical protein
MPTIRIAGPYWFHFYSNENLEPTHLHVERERKVAKFWLEPVALAENDGFAQHELRRIVGLIEANKSQILKAWNDHEKQK